jgi:hypothetical protein
MGEALVAEIRAARLDLAARAEFAADGDEIEETRSVLFPDGNDRTVHIGLTDEEIRRFEMDAVEMR